MVQRTTASIFLLLAAGAAADAPGEQPVADPDDVRLLENFLENVRTMESSFEQSLVDANNAVVETSRGSVVIRRPGQFRWHYTDPYEQILVADGLNIWSYDVDLEQVTVKPQEEMLANTPATLLGGNLGALDDFEVTATESDQHGTVWLTLAPGSSDNGFTRIELGFDDGVLRRMMFTDNLEQTTLVALLDVVLNEPVDDSLFELDVPDGVDLVGEPLVEGDPTH